MCVFARSDIKLSKSGHGIPLRYAPTKDVMMSLDLEFILKTAHKLSFHLNLHAPYTFDFSKFSCHALEFASLLCSWVRPSFATQ